MDYQPDRQFNVTIPSHHRMDQVILYNFKVQDFLQNQVYMIDFRFKDLQDYHKKLAQKKFDMPEFPKTHFWISTNKDPDLVKKRRQKLEYFFNMILNDPKIRGHPEIKQFIKICRNYGEKLKPRNISLEVLSDKGTESTRRSKSLDGPKGFKGGPVKLVK